jgi:hypothetical protein
MCISQYKLCVMIRLKMTQFHHSTLQGVKLATTTYSEVRLLRLDTEFERNSVIKYTRLINPRTPAFACFHTVLRESAAVHLTQTVIHTNLRY